MTDLVERLRYEVIGEPTGITRMCREAADEIEQLREALKPFVEEKDWLGDDQLRLIASGHLYNNACDEEEAAQQIAARAALRGK